MKKAKMETINLSTILRYVLENGGKPYPLPSMWDVRGDVGEAGDPYCCFWFEEEHWCSVSQAAFAREVVVPPTTVSRWLNAGLPQLPDGRIVLWQGKRWLEKHRKHWYEAHQNRLFRMLCAGQKPKAMDFADDFSDKLDSKESDAD
jgi:hypothetical protein